MIIIIFCHWTAGLTAVHLQVGVHEIRTPSIVQSDCSELITVVQIFTHLPLRLCCHAFASCVAMF